MMIIAGLSYPVPAAVFGAVWVLGRGLYAFGYYQGVKQRNWGSMHYLGVSQSLVMFSLGLHLSAPDPTVCSVVSGSVGPVSGFRHSAAA